MLGTHLLKGWSKTQTLIALSSGESELYATLKAASEGLGMMSVARDLGISLSGEVWGDASAALGIIKRRGLGKTRHIDTGLLWIQEVAAEKRLKFGKVLGRDNPADLFTKYLDWDTMHRHCTRLSTSFDDGRAETAPKLHMLKLVWEVDDEDSRWDIMSIVGHTNGSMVKYEEDEFGLLQPVMSISRARCTGSVHTRPNEPGKVTPPRDERRIMFTQPRFISAISVHRACREPRQQLAEPSRGTSNARAPAKEPGGKHTTESGTKRFVKGGQMVQVSNWPRPQLSQGPLCPTDQTNDGDKYKDQHNQTAQSDGRETDTGVVRTGLPSQGCSLAGEAQESVRRDSAVPRGLLSADYASTDKTQHHNVQRVNDTTADESTAPVKRTEPCFGRCQPGAPCPALEALDHVRGQDNGVDAALKGERAPKLNNNTTNTTTTTTTLAHTSASDNSEFQHSPSKDVTVTASLCTDTCSRGAAPLPPPQGMCFTRARMLPSQSVKRRTLEARTLRRSTTETSSTRRSRSAQSELIRRVRSRPQGWRLRPKSLRMRTSVARRPQCQ